MKKQVIYKKMFEDLLKPGFRGLLVFQNPQNLRAWMEFSGEYLIRMGGKYSHSTYTWEFDWGSSLKLCTIESIERKTGGNIFSHIEVDDNVDQRITDLLMTKKRIII